MELFNLLIYLYKFIYLYLPNKSLGECPNTAGKFLDTFVIRPV